jgi:hypothetical protein
MWHSSQAWQAAACMHRLTEDRCQHSLLLAVWSTGPQWMFRILLAGRCCLLYACGIWDAPAGEAVDSPDSTPPKPKQQGLTPHLGGRQVPAFFLCLFVQLCL